MNTHPPLRLLILGAHPDDAEYHAGGLASRYRQLGHAVKMVSVTNGLERGSRIEYAEMFEISEYGSPLDEAARARLFPFAPHP